MSGLSSLYNRAMTGLGSLRGGNNAIGRGLASLDRLANEQLRYLTGPQGYAALTGATALAREVTPAADFRDVADYSGRLVKSDTLGDVLGNTAGLGAAGAMVFLPGSMGMVDDAVDGARKALTPSQKQADDVLRLIKEDPSKVTDDMLGALDAEGNRYLFDNYDLPMDEASRMARADEFFPSSAAHGSGADIKAVDNDRLIGGQFWSTDDLPAIAREEVGAAGHGVTIPLRLKTDNPAGWREYDKFGVDELIGRGYDSLRLPEKDGTNTFVTFDPNQVRSRFARFDPRLKHLSNLLAGGAGLAVLPRSVWEDDDANR